MKRPSEISFRADLLEGVLMAFAEGAAQRIGQLLVNGVVTAIRTLRQQRQAGDPRVPHVNPNAISASLEGSAFGEFARDQVESWALCRLSQMPRAQGAALLESAAHAGNGEVRSIMVQLVRDFAMQQVS